ASGAGSSSTVRPVGAAGGRFVDGSRIAEPHVVATTTARTAPIVMTRRTRGVCHPTVKIGSMLIQIRFRDAIASGAVSLTFRRWRRPQVVPGNTYRTAAGRIVVEAIDVVDPDRITAAEAKRAG